MSGLAFRGASAVTVTGRFVVLGDLQRTSRLEFWRESNDRHRATLMEAVADARPDFVALLGDLVFRGDSPPEWRELDALLAPFRDARMPVLPILGNHDYGLRRRVALALFGARFPECATRSYYALPYGPLTLLFLDSNKARMSRELWEEQRRWYQTELRRCDDDAGCRAVLVLVHHPPFTNSTVTADDMNVRETFVPAFLAGAKTRCMISGHVHSYERFERHGKAFVVAGGGGAPRVRLREGRERRHGDDQVRGPRIRPLHFLVCTLADGELTVEVRGLTEETRTFALLDRFELRLA